MQDEFFSWDQASGTHPYPDKPHLRFMEVVCLGGDYDDLTVSETICARFSDEEIQLLGLTE